MQNQKCTGILGWFLGHKFEPRYNTIPKDSVTVKDAVSMLKSSTDSLVHRMRGADEAADVLANLNNAVVEIFSSGEQKYIKDVCIHCGLEVVNATPTPERRIEPEL